ncbi:hypothetical protein [Obesumbacterium proteus]|uniref:Uncharacterized protein n=1 Tax=Obesumbacterium proteus ATCC 12841 TaxID=1354268 RepID=A0AA91IMZ6_9GAMM|nr:hypothetical protein [Obesumbacterium proteus]AMO82034.1 hypothetical protein DSM2777_13965 [Obesumbacterium proteus]OAT57277.1 hypothetical protein M993_04483 [Obesumbacterium proteus ATCC 12841]
MDDVFLFSRSHFMQSAIASITGCRTATPRTSPNFKFQNPIQTAVAVLIIRPKLLLIDTVLTCAADVQYLLQRLADESYRSRIVLIVDNKDAQIAHRYPLDFPELNIACIGDLQALSYIIQSTSRGYLVNTLSSQIYLGLQKHISNKFAALLMDWDAVCSQAKDKGNGYKNILNRRSYLKKKLGLKNKTEIDLLIGMLKEPNSTSDAASQLHQSI